MILYGIEGGKAIAETAVFCAVFFEKSALFCEVSNKRLLFNGIDGKMSGNMTEIFLFSPTLVNATKSKEIFSYENFVRAGGVR